MNFGEAIKLSKEGKMVAREGWNGKGMYVFNFYSGTLKLREDTDFSEELYDLSELEDIVEIGWCENTYKLQDFLLLKTANNMCIPWVANQEDVFAEDWNIISIEK